MPPLDSEVVNIGTAAEPVHVFKVPAGNGYLYLPSLAADPLVEESGTTYLRINLGDRIARLPITFE